MRVSRRCEIAIDLLVFCARSPEEVVRTSSAAEFANTTVHFTHQVMLQLVRAGMLGSIRGQQGGIRLARRANHIVVGEVVRLMEPSPPAAQTPLRSPMFRRIVEEAAHAAFNMFDAFTIADLVEGPSSARLACLNCEYRALLREPPRPQSRDRRGEAQMVQSSDADRCRSSFPQAEESRP